jgi:antitoxin (DNA-binding transcriptional repressor) of toxin-antitoxin stability system
MKTVSASEANRQFSKLLRTIARIVSTFHESRSRELARATLLQMLSRQTPTGQRDGSRADLYNR